jgi:hypothetical protein
MSDLCAVRIVNLELLDVEAARVPYHIFTFIKLMFFPFCRKQYIQLGDSVE